MSTPEISRGNAPIGVLNALFIGFDRVAARPVLILPPLLLDLLLWLGPKARITPILSRAAAALADLPGASQMTAEQMQILQDGLRILGERLNLLGALSAFPTGVPSLMTSRLPAASPLATYQPLDLGNPGISLLLWAVLTVLGLGLGGLYHRWLAQQVIDEGSVSSGWTAWWRLTVLAAFAYTGMFVAFSGTLFLASLVGWILPLFGVAVILTSFSLLFWVAVYLIFSPHAIVRYRMGVLQALSDSALVVRWNTLGTAGFLILAFGILWLTDQVWLLPGDRSWFNLLGIAGHAFVVGMLLVGSYAFYQGRRQWLMGILERRASEVRVWEQVPPEDPSERD